MTVRPDEPPVPSYRCVCGAVFDVTPGFTGNCPQCQRKYTAEALERGLAETVMLPVNASAADAIRVVHDLPAAAPSDADLDPLIDSRLGHFRIESCLGKGGMGAVYQALDESLQRYVALKVIRTDRAAADKTHFRRLLQEARAQARVNHPNVVQIYFVGLDETAPYLAMELSTGPNLAQRLAAGPISFVEVIRIALQLTSALERAAQYDIVHGDIKPCNILTFEGNSVKVADFGLARSLTDGEARGISGSPNYLSPEAARGDSLDSRSDMYSLGITLFELNFGRLPYENPSGTIQTQLLAHIEQAPRFPDPWPVDLPMAWRDVLATLLAKDRADRYASYDELRQALKQVQPVAVRNGAALPRALAWLFDLLVTLFFQLLLITPLMAAQVLEKIPDSPLFVFLTAAVNACLTLTVLLSMGWLQSVWGSPGKKLFQLKVVDLHGLPPPRRLGLPRVFLQLPLCTAVSAVEYCGAVGLDSLTSPLYGLAGAIILLNAGFVLFGRNSRSIHDYLFRTRVVVDAR